MRSPEQYQPSNEEIKKAEENMTEFEEKRSYERSMNYFSFGEEGDLSDIKGELDRWDTGMRMAPLDHFFVTIDKLHAKAEKNTGMQKIIEDIGASIKKNLTSKSVTYKELGFPIKHQDALSKITHSYLMDDNHAVIRMWGEWSGSPMKGKSSYHNIFYEIHREGDDVEMSQILGLEDSAISSVYFDDKDKKLQIEWKKYSYCDMAPVSGRIEPDIYLKRTTIDKDGNRSDVIVRQIQKAYDKYYREKYGDNYEEKFQQKEQRQKQLHERAKSLLGNKYDEVFIDAIVIYLSPEQENILKQIFDKLEQMLEKEQGEKEKDNIRKKWLKKFDPWKNWKKYNLGGSNWLEKIQF